MTNEKIQVTFPGRIHTDVTKIVELECYKTLAKIKAIIKDDALADSECFQQIEEIVCTYEDQWRYFACTEEEITQNHQWGIGQEELIHALTGAA